MIQLNFNSIAQELFASTLNQFYNDPISLNKRMEDIFYYCVKSSPEMQPVLISAVGGGALLFAIRYLYKTITKPQNHLITMPEAAKEIFAGHRSDPMHHHNLFSNDHSVTPEERAFECATIKESKQLRGFLMSHLKCQIKKKSQLITEQINNWALTFTQSPKKLRDFFVTSSASPEDEEMSEVERFAMQLCWNTFIGSGEPPIGFGSKTRKRGEYTYTLSDLDILQNAMSKKKLVEPKLVLKMVNDVEAGCKNLANLLNNCLLNLSKNEQLREQIFAELTQLQNQGFSFDKAASKSSLIFKFICEMLRTFDDVASIIRENARRPFILENPNFFQKEILVKRGDNVIINFDKIKESLGFSGFDSNQINLERPYLEKIKNLQELPWVPFASGFHVCPGIATIHSISSLFVAVMVSKYEFNDYMIEPRSNP